jgi:hypothetical protein
MSAVGETSGKSAQGTVMPIVISQSILLKCLFVFDALVKACLSSRNLQNV